MTQAEDMQREADRYALGLRIFEVAKDCADGYRRNISQFNTAAENGTAERCACAANNTGVFILQALGYSTEQIKGFVTARMAPPPSRVVELPRVKVEHEDGSITYR